MWLQISIGENVSRRGLGFALLLVLFVTISAPLQADNRSAQAGGVLSENFSRAGAVPPGSYRLALVPPIGEASEAKEIAHTALRRIADIQGIPYDFISSPDRLSSYETAVLTLGPSNGELSSDWREALYAFVEDGGVLFVPGKPGSDLFPLLGIEGIRSLVSRSRLEFSGSDPIYRYIDHPNERTISLGNGHEEVYDELIWSHGAEAGAMAEVIARFGDGSAAILRNYYGRGIAYFLGVDFVETVMLPQTGGDYEAQRKFVNSVEPSADVIMLLVKALYEEYVRYPVYLSPIPGARATALVLTHDVDAQTSFVDSLKFARLAEEFGARSTFFINTKYFTDRMDIGYYSVLENMEALRELHRRGHELGSHTVSHALEFDEAPVGSPIVSFENYRPKERISINGEVRVSRELLERDVAGHRTTSFRAGYLAFPPELIEVLDSAGYRYDSSFSANDVLTTFPYYAFEERRPGSPESGVIEIPVTLDDAVGFLTEETKESAVEKWKEIVKAHAGNEAITVLLIHPSDTRQKSYKLDAQRELMEYARSIGSWMGGLTDFGDFWRRRHETGVDVVEHKGDLLKVGLDRTASQVRGRIGIVVHPPPGVRRVEIFDLQGKSIDYRKRVEGEKWFLGLR